MRRVIVLNTKGGCGKTTVATNLAACYAARGLRTTLFDYDPQCSSLSWLKIRSRELPPIHGVAAHEPSGAPLSGAWQMRVPRDTQRIVVDTPAGLRASDLVGRVQPSDSILIPIQPSAIDIRATADFIRDLLLVGKVRQPQRRIGIIGNRTRRQRNSFDLLQRFLASLNIPVVEYLNDAQIYVDAAEEGRGVCELPHELAPREVDKWRAIMNWLDEGMEDRTPVARPTTHGEIRPIVPMSHMPVHVPKPVLAAGEPLRATQPEPRIPAFVSKDAGGTRH
ncbi:MAG: ParA family protein [Gammaproteobacteria bacterium]|nr:ParA family protein [Gammaproteobacteria bacterium]